eukprot:TRINITY_DN11751_c0_g1_i1.p1 TRINITY_DN11751_c0_g1~~TRINITY_DN11751_c0_g1_i1.p1  ORF type:complete len:519 (+),score=101.80 TRINITY_DN11751_c0_g1_i1:150-1706(+)
MLLMTVNSFIKSLVEPLSRFNKIEDQTREVVVSDVPQESYDSKYVDTRVRINLESFQLFLKKEGKTLISLGLGGTRVELLLNQIGMDLDAQVSSFEIQDGYHGTWSKLLYMDHTKRLQLFFNTYDPLSTTYPGYDTNLHLTIPSITYVFTNKIVQELITYFGAFSDIQEVLSLHTNMILKARKEKAEQKSTEKLNLSINVDNPVIIIPRCSTVYQNHLFLFHLGHIMVTNKIITKSGIWLDEMMIRVTNINVSSQQDSFTSRLCDDMNVKVMIERPITPDPSHALPKLKVCMDVSQIELKFNDHVLDLVFGVLKDNSVEQVTCNDTELEVVSNYLDFNFSLWDERILSDQVDTEEAHERLFSLSIDNFGLRLSSSTGVEQDSISSCFWLSINKLDVYLQNLSSQHNNMNVTLEDIILEDTRQSTKNIYRQVLLSNKKQGNLIELRIQEMSSLVNISCGACSPILYVVPDVFGNLVTFAVSLYSKINQFSREIEKLEQKRTKVVVLRKKKTEKKSRTLR